MYSTCLFCNKPLGANETFETFPVGRRIAFDAAKGRLWVVCPHCERWNLSPLEERWEAIELGEKLYRDARRRVSTDNVGLAKLRDGTTLVRIGEPLRPEFAAWRYGDQFGRRRNRQMLIAGAGVVAVGSVVAGGMAAGVSVVAFSGLYGNVGRFLIHGRGETVVAKIRTADGIVLPVRRRHLSETSLDMDSDGRLVLNLRHKMLEDEPHYRNGRTRFVGRDAERVAAVVVPAVNRFGAPKQGVADAVQTIEDAGGPQGLLERVARSSRTPPEYSIRPSWGRRRSMGRFRTDTGLFALPKNGRLALEMALHEEAERRALDGELEELERAWKDAETVAAISDDLLIPDSVRNTIDRLR
jgi:hypothetical protein